MINLENWAYRTLMGGGYKRDSWRLYGEVYGHPEREDGAGVYVSRPIDFDAEARTIKGLSGRLYKLGECAGNEEEQIQFILNDIERGKSLQF